MSWLVGSPSRLSQSTNITLVIADISGHSVSLPLYLLELRF
jgi:hypothetical protein